MPTPQSTVYSKDEELGKRDDDFRPKRSSTANSLMQPWQWRKRRLFLVVAVALFVYVFVKNIPTDLGPADERLGYPMRRPGQVPRSRPQQGTPPGYPKTEPVGAPRRLPQKDEEADMHYYDGPIRYHRLALSLRGIQRTKGSALDNRNVLFSVSSLKSAANLMPMACEMARWDRNYVHFALHGRDSLPLQDILEINGVSKEDCPVSFHDARAEYSEYSSDQRAEAAVAGSMKHFQDYMHPQAIITDDGEIEEAFHARALRRKGKDMGVTVIEIPAGRYEEFFYMARLDSGSLSNWFRPNVDILVQAAPGNSGSLLRLLSSLESAYYTGLRIPKLTIELPNDVEPAVQKYLALMDWPQGSGSSHEKQSALTLHHRISSSHQTPEQASIRFLESIFPKNTVDNHVLILSPQAELSPMYLQYLHYLILEYKYSKFAAPDSENLLGISLDIPSTFLNGSNGFSAPKIADAPSTKLLSEKDHDQQGPSPFLYQAPSATASLIFGSKWATMHDFLTKRINARHSGLSRKMEKLVSETEPSWLEYLLELMRARGYYILHPASPFVTVHNELAQIPEEYLRHPEEDKQASKDPDTAPPGDEDFLLASNEPALHEHVEHEPRAAQALHSLLPFAGDLPELAHLPFISHEGGLIDFAQIAEQRDTYLAHFRQYVGGCGPEEAARKRVPHDSNTDDLFCLPGVEVEYEDEMETEAAAKTGVEEIEAVSYD
ncbi:hypothetical protein D0867_06467 [Hortaea werneckii]|uniref:Glycosyltransferase 2 n=1 Tax=Hortaea werneckii TaxID=91943 RepID=A0A3M7B5V0_HORWE|nr:hypothetical protein KC334_g12857 [Hortaea werneckii]RMY16600.1 hypothetical protein D0867_06467 [Hortaea werneckii]RMY35144.1 hypothetical protein D0866_04794 [Hortaea werneckii]